MPKTIKLEPHLRSEELENRYRKAHDDPVLRSHYQILWLISEGKTTSQVMEATGYYRGWIQQIARRYNASGPEALGDRRHQNPGARERALLTQELQEELREALKKPPADGGMWSSPKVGEWIENRTGHVLTQKKQRGWEYMRKLGQSAKVPRPHHRKANKADQDAFKKPLHVRVMRLKESYPTAKVELWCEDERRLGLKPIVRKVWSPIGDRPLIEVHQRYEWTYLYAFARPNRAGRSTG
jgi:transposase